MQTKTQNLSIVEALMALNDGGAIEELATEVRSCVAAVTATGKKGSVTLTLNIAPNGKDAVKIIDKVAVKLPKADGVETMFYVTDEAGLSRRDPRQPSLTGTD